MNNNITLLNELDAKKTYFKTDSYSMSIGEVANLYKQQELIIRPEYQRLFRWTYGQKVKLIESLMLGIPLPTIFIFQGEDGIWELVDGLQRISTILQFMGELEGEEKLVLSKTEYLSQFENVVWSKTKDKEVELESPLKLSFKRTKLNFTIIYSESDSRAKFEVFQRLNTGGSNASKQEIRNSVQLMIRPEIYEWFRSLSTEEGFLNTLSLTDRLLDEQYHLELLLRFIALINFAYDPKKDLGDYLDDINKQILYDNDFDLTKSREIFINTFNYINNNLEDKAFKKFNGDVFGGKFLESAFEAIAIGLAYNIDDYGNEQNEVFINKVKELYVQGFYKDNAGSGSNAKTRINRLIPAAKEYFSLR